MLPALIILTILAAAVAIHLYRRQSRLRRRLDLLLQALDAGDTSMRFPVTPDRSVNTSLNRIADILAAMRLKAIETDRYFETIISSTATGLLVADTRGNILLTNPAALRLLQRPALAYVSALRPAWTPLADLLSDPHPGTHTIRNLAVNTSLFTTRTGERRIIVTLDDISAQLEAATVDSWVEMSRVLTHEIMNGIAPIVSISDTLLMRDDRTRPYLTDGLEAIGDSSRSLRDFVERYNRVTRVPAPRPTDFPLTPLLTQALTLTNLHTPSTLQPNTGIQPDTRIHPATTFTDSKTGSNISASSFQSTTTPTHTQNTLTRLIPIAPITPITHISPILQLISPIRHISPIRPIHSTKSANAPAIALTLPVAPIILHADRSQILQVLINLLKNAREATPTRITITATLTPTFSHSAHTSHSPHLTDLNDLKDSKHLKDSKDLTSPSHLTLTIENDGQPIPPSHVDRIFTPFFTTKPGGSGIGLSLSRRIVTLNRGTLSLTSTTPRTRFTLTLPAR